MQTADQFIIDNLKEFLADSDVETTIKSLRKIAKDISIRFYDDIILLSSRYNRVVKQQRSGLIEHNNFNIEVNRISSALLSYINEIPQQNQRVAVLHLLNSGTNAQQPFNITIPDNAYLEKIIGLEELFQINWIEKALLASKSVCKVVRPDGGTGTGFLLNGNYLLTNQHVLEHKEMADKAKIIFNYGIDAQETVQQTSEYQLDTSTFYTSKFKELDYTLVKVFNNKDVPLSNWGNLTLDNFSVPQKDHRVNIIQHPDGDFMKIALPDKIIGSLNQHLFYITDTKKGSSGSPVFNQDWQVVALHHAGKTVQDGFIINAQGDKAHSNRGILIKNIIEDVKKQSNNSIILA